MTRARRTAVILLVAVLVLTVTRRAGSGGDTFFAGEAGVGAASASAGAEDRLGADGRRGAWTPDEAPGGRETPGAAGRPSGSGGEDKKGAGALPGSSQGQGGKPTTGTRRPKPPSPDLGPLKQKVASIVDSSSGRFGISFVDLRTGESFGINEDDVFTAASTFKLPLNLYLYTLAAKGQIDLDEKMTFTEDDYEDGTGVIQNEQPGAEFTLRRLSEVSITVSDNVAANMLIRRLGYDQVLAFARSLGAKAPEQQNGYSMTTPKDMAIYLKAVLALQKKYPALGDELLGYLANTEFNDRLPGKLPPGLTVAHKIGTQVNVINDAGIVFLKGRPYLLVELSERVDEIAAVDLEAEVSKTVYDYMVAVRGNSASG